MPRSEDTEVGRGSAAELLSKWRAAERDSAAAREAVNVADLASAAAQEAAQAATETSDAARLSLEAAQRADLAAKRTSEAAAIFAKAAAVDAAAATRALGESQAAEVTARDEFHQAQEHGFSKDGSR